jgi:pilus assembly protein Flp/PilA
MGKTGTTGRLSYAARGRAAGRLVTRSVVRFWRDETGATAIEYALIAVFIALAIVAGFTAVGPKITDKVAIAANGLL